MIAAVMMFASEEMTYLMRDGHGLGAADGQRIRAVD